jgi:hypothetical protein
LKILKARAQKEMTAHAALNTIKSEVNKSEEAGRTVRWMVSVRQVPMSVVSQRYAY